MEPIGEQPPLEVEVRRGGCVESRHRVRFAVARSDGAIVRSGGDIRAPVFPRSAIKPLQAVPLVESGAADRFGLGEVELALACASHSGQPEHVSAVGSWLSKIGCSADDLQCGAHLPYDEESAHRLIQAGERPGALHNNCSGKHAGMLALARHLGAPLRGYVEPDHPVQRAVAEVLQSFCDQPQLPAPGIDGCGVPTWPVPLGGLAIAAARIASPAGLPDARRDAVRRLVAAMRSHPNLVAGERRPCTRIMRALPEVVVKTGAEGVYFAALPARRLGLALKVEDGATRAAVAALMHLLRLVGVDLPDRLQDLATPVLTNRAGAPVGEIAVRS
ncbi:MAG TPA: asparaginase [Geminicoccaceae bacterium]